uniref:Uncharacterized protein n=1 Tax=Physcomitrium patens TaxID=3218 RepID=A0A7I4BM71_PHYPA
MWHLPFHRSTLHYGAHYTQI